jgi:two-component system, OmpR family, response regulator
MNPPTTPTTILVVDDEQIITSMLEFALKFLGFEVITASTGAEAVSLVRAGAPDAVLLDVMLPGLDGFQVCRELRESGVDVPVLFVTARAGNQDKVQGLMLGGDDYITKPFELDELAARLHAVLRRTRSTPQSGESAEVGWVRLDLGTRQAWVRGGQVQLSATEFDVAWFLLRNVGRVVSKREILDAVWKSTFRRGPALVETYVHYLRRKLDDTEQELIRTVRGVGYLVSAA